MNNLFIISGPSGAGQDSVINGLAKILPIEIVMTSTTRPKREGESEGNPYYFVTPEKFETGIRSGLFLEYAKTYNHQYYGVTRLELERVMQSGKIGIWKMDWKGVQTAKQLFPTIVAILVTAPLPLLETRIRRRDNPSEEFIRERMAYTQEFMQHADIYDYQVTNEEGKLDATVAQVKAIIEQYLTRT